MTFTCVKCGKGFKAKPSEAAKRKFCTRRCAWERTQRDERVAEMYLAGRSFQEVGRAFGITGQRVKAILMRRGVEKRPSIRSREWAMFKPRRIKPLMAERFWGLVDKSIDPMGCWNWRGDLWGNQGYGRFSGAGGRNRKQVYAHRLAFLLSHGKAPEGWVMQLCYNHLCCNPQHLIDRPPKSAIERRERTGRSRHPAKFTGEQAQHILDLLANGLSMREVAKQMGCSYETVRLMRNGKTKAYRPFVQTVPAYALEQIPRALVYQVTGRPSEGLL